MRFHDYCSPTVGSPGDQWNGLQVRIDQCDDLGKPIFVGEAGIIPNEGGVGGTFQGRADAFQAKIEAQFGAGVRGFLGWAWSPGSTASTLDGYDIGPGDPALDALIGPYAFSSYAPPVDAFPILNLMKAGAAVPVKFSLGGDRGLDILAPGSPLVRTIDCTSTSSSDAIEETVTAGTSSLSYDASTDLYTYVWKTKKGWRGTCQQLVLLFVDGAWQRAGFRFKG